jgi:hypothetical protein
MMNLLLRDLVSQCIEHRDSSEKLMELTDRINDLRLTDRDFGDEFVESFDAKKRMELYTMVLAWVDAPYGLKILKDRLISEKDWRCIQRLQSIVIHLKGRGLL